MMQFGLCYGPKPADCSACGHVAVHQGRIKHTSNGIQTGAHAVIVDAFAFHLQLEPWHLQGLRLVPVLRVLMGQQLLLLLH